MLPGRSTFTLAVVLFTGIIGYTPFAQAVTLNIDSTGQLLGAFNVRVDGTFFDVTFKDGTCRELFDGCDDATDFTFRTESAAIAAGTALLTQVLVNGPSGRFDSEPFRATGCTDSRLCVTFIPFNLGLNNLIFATATSNGLRSDGDLVQAVADREPTRDTRGQQGENFAHFTLSPSPPPAVPVAPPNHPKFLNPDVDRVLVMGLPADHTRVWEERTFPNDDGNQLALCVDHLTSQRIFPAAGPAVGDGMFCLADLTITGVHQFSAKVILASRLVDSTSERSVVFPNCSVLVERENDSSGVTTLNRLSRQHVVTCSSDNGGRSRLIGSFTTDSNGIGDGQPAGIHEVWINTQFEKSASSSN